MVAQATIWHVQSVPRTGQSRSAQHIVLATTAGEHRVVLLASVPEGTEHRQDLESEVTVQLVVLGGCSPAGPAAETLPHGASHSPTRHAASAALAGEPSVGKATARHEAPALLAHASTALIALRQVPSVQH